MEIQFRIYNPRHPRIYNPQYPQIYNLQRSRIYNLKKPRQGLFPRQGLPCRGYNKPRLLPGAELLQFREVLDGADHLAGVAVLVVVPRNNLHLVGIIRNL